MQAVFFIFESIPDSMHLLGQTENQLPTMPIGPFKEHGIDLQHFPMRGAL